MEEKKELNLVEILKDCPKGTKLWSPICGECTLDSIDESNYPITLLSQREGSIEYCYLTENGHHLTGVSGECVLFPSKDNRDWSTFKVEKPKWNPDTMQPFDKVLVRDGCEEPWKCDFFVSMNWPNSESYPYMAVSGYYKMIVPYNEDTKHLIAKSDEAPEYYRQ